MVRLLLEPLWDNRSAKFVVSIPQWCDCCPISSPISCHDTGVSIPQWCDCCWWSFRFAGEEGEFQSHNGAIAATSLLTQQNSPPHVSIPQWCDCCYFCEFVDMGWSEMFQSHNGAIAATNRPGHHCHFQQVSIPQWCDCCNHPTHPASVLVCVSIPQWCDCCKSVKLPSKSAKMVSIPQWCDCCTMVLRT